MQGAPGNVRAWPSDCDANRARGRDTGLCARRQPHRTRRVKQQILKTGRGDTVHPSLEIIDLVPGKTMGVIRLKTTVYKQKWELVM